MSILGTDFRQRATKALYILRTEGLAETVDNTTQSIRFRSYRGDGLYKSYLQWRADNEGYLQRTIHGHKMKLDVNDPGVGIQLLVQGTREERMTAYWQQLLQPGMTVIEVGSNIGYYTLQTAELVGGEGVIHAFEPVESNTELLKTNLALNGYENVVLNEVALTDATGTEEFTVTSQSNLGTIVGDGERFESTEYFNSSMADRSMNVEEVDAISLDDYCSTKGIDDFDVLRMDIEGGETKALAGMTEVAERVSPPCVLVIEVHTNYFEDITGTAKEMFEPLLEAGFSPDQIISSKGTIDELDIPAFYHELEQFDDGSPHAILRKRDD